LLAAFGFGRYIDLGLNNSGYPAQPHSRIDLIIILISDFVSSDSQSEYDDERTLSGSEGSSSTKGEEDMEISYGDDCGSIEVVVEQQYGPETREEWKTRLQSKLKEKFEAMNVQSDEHKKYFSQDRVVVDVDIILNMFQNCQIKTCMAKGEVKGWHIKGGVLHVMWTCENGHADDWTSSKVLCEKRGQKVFVNTLLMAASILITGNNFEKVRTLFTFLGTGFLSASTFHRIQRNYVVPEVSSLWEEMKKEIWAVLNNETLILCGDGRSDSPGFSAKYGTYLLMEQFLEVIVDLEVIDKRQTGGVSTNMEVAGLKMLLERIVGNLVVSEVVTDASTAVMALVRRMKGNYKQM
jgi:hypothetical protein